MTHHLATPWIRGTCVTSSLKSRESRGWLLVWEKPCRCGATIFSLAKHTGKVWPNQQEGTVWLLTQAPSPQLLLMIKMVNIKARKRRALFLLQPPHFSLLETTARSSGKRSRISPTCHLMACNSTTEIPSNVHIVARSNKYLTGQSGSKMYQSSRGWL